MNSRNTIRAFICGIVLILPAGFPIASGEHPVVSVNGKIITEEDIDHYLVRIGPPHRDFPEDPQAMLRIKQTALSELVSKQFYADLLESENLEIADDELDKEFNDMLSALPKETIEEMKRIVDAVRPALEAWHANPADEKVVFETHLAEIMTYPDWGAYRDADGVLKQADKATGWREYLRVMSGDGLRRQLAWKKLKQRVATGVVVEEAEVRREYEENYPKPEYWDVLHFYHLDEEEIRLAAEALLQGERSQETYAMFLSLPEDTGGVFNERILDRPYFPFYARDIRELREGEVGPITSGILARDPMMGEGKIACQYYHLLYVDEIGRHAKVLPFERVRAAIEKVLLQAKKEAVWQEWLLEQYDKTDIEVMDKRFKVPGLSDGCKSISLITHAASERTPSTRNDNGGKSLPPSQAIDQ